MLCCRSNLLSPVNLNKLTNTEKRASNADRIKSQVAHNVRYLRWQGIEARHADTEADFFSFAEDKNKCSIAFRRAGTKAE